eukprot:6482252-Amphidinium_carterae.1
MPRVKATRVAKFATNSSPRIAIDWEPQLVTARVACTLTALPLECHNVAEVWPFTAHSLPSATCPRRMTGLGSSVWGVQDYIWSAAV